MVYLLQSATSEGLTSVCEVEGLQNIYEVEGLTSICEGGSLTSVRVVEHALSQMAQAASA